MKKSAIILIAVAVIVALLISMDRVRGMSIEEMEKELQERKTILESERERISLEHEIMEEQAQLRQEKLVLDK